MLVPPHLFTRAHATQSARMHTCARKHTHHYTHAACVAWAGADFEAFTLLHQSLEGLEVFEDQEWHMAPDEGHFIVLVGDVLERWTNKMWPAARHRVRRPAVHPRFSIVRFIAVDLDVEIRPVRELLVAGIAPAFEPVTQRALIEMKNAAAEANRAAVRDQQHTAL